MSSKPPHEPDQLHRLPLSEKMDASIDPQLLASISPHPPGDQIDRSIVVASLIKNASSWALRLFIIGAFLYALARMAGNFWQGILPVVLAIIVCTVLAPVASFLRKSGFPSAAAAAVCILGFFGVIGGVFAVIAPSFAAQSQTLYLQTVEGIQRLQIWIEGPPLNITNRDLSSLIDEMARWFQARAGSIAGSVFTGISTATSVIVTLVVVLVLTFFFLKDGHNFLKWLRSITGRRSGWHLTEVLTRVWNTLGGYIRAQALVSAIDAVFIGLGLLIVGVPLAMALAIITFLAGFIPYAGAIVAGSLSVGIALVSLGPTKALIVLAIVLVVQQLEGNVLSPLLHSRALNLHPVVVLISVTIGSALFQLVGAFLAVPAAATFAVVWRYVQENLMLRSGEASVDDLEYSTVAGYLIARSTAEDGAAGRAEFHAMQTQDVEESTTTVFDLDLNVDAPLRPAQPTPPQENLSAGIKNLKSGVDKFWDKHSRRGSRNDSSAG